MSALSRQSSPQYVSSLSLLLSSLPSPSPPISFTHTAADVPRPSRVSTNVVQPRGTLLHHHSGPCTPHGHPLSSNLPSPSLQPYERLNLADALERRRFQDGEVIIRQGDPAYSFFMIEEGVVSVTMVDVVRDTHTHHPSTHMLCSL